MMTSRSLICLLENQNGDKLQKISSRTRFVIAIYLPYAGSEISRVTTLFAARPHGVLH
jgi:hypothetical protein